MGAAIAQVTEIGKGQAIDPGKAIDRLPRGTYAGQQLELYGGGLILPNSFGEVIEFAQMMSKAGLAIPKHLRDQPGICMAVIQRSLSWQMDPWAVSTKTYAVNDILAYEAQLIAAVVKKWAPIKERIIKPTYTGSNGDLQCSFTLHDRETNEEIPYVSPKVKDIKVKNSPLWTSDPEQQLYYYSVRAMARRYFPEILMGVYDREEAIAMKDITPKAERVVHNMLDDGPAETAAAEGEVLAPERKEEPKSEFERAAETFDEIEQDTGEPEDHSLDDRMTDEATEEVEEVVSLERIIMNLERSIDACQTVKACEALKAEHVHALKDIPPDEAKRLRKRLVDRAFDLEDL